MLACKHDSSQFGSPTCEHLRVVQERAIPYVKWYIKAGLNTELLCVPCAGRRAQGLSIDVAYVCQPCFEHIISEVGYVERFGGKPEIAGASSSRRARVGSVERECLNTVCDRVTLHNESRLLDTQIRVSH